VRRRGRLGPARLSAPVRTRTRFPLFGHAAPGRPVTVAHGPRQTGADPMNDGFGATTEEMQKAARQVLTVNDAVQADLAMLRTRLVPLAGGWRGEAASVFTRLMARWDADAMALNEALRTIGQAIDTSGSSYRAHEDEHTTGMSTIRAALG
jgi:WXG100 family type VII secretion target